MQIGQPEVTLPGLNPPKMEILHDANGGQIGTKETTFLTIKGMQRIAREVTTYKTGDVISSKVEEINNYDDEGNQRGEQILTRTDYKEKTKSFQEVRTNITYNPETEETTETGQQAFYHDTESNLEKLTHEISFTRIYDKKGRLVNKREQRKDYPKGAGTIGGQVIEGPEIATDYRYDELDRRIGEMVSIDSTLTYEMTYEYEKDNPSPWRRIITDKRNGATQFCRPWKRGRPFDKKLRPMDGSQSWVIDSNISVE